jgi:hypothetical protein
MSHDELAVSDTVHCRSNLLAVTSLPARSQQARPNPKKPRKIKPSPGRLSSTDNDVAPILAVEERDLEEVADWRRKRKVHHHLHRVNEIGS